MSTLDRISNNFKFHDRTMRAIGYFLKAVSYTKTLNHTRIGAKLSQTGSKISWVRQTLRIGGELAVIQTLCNTIKNRSKLTNHGYYGGLLECIMGFYFYIWDHLEWAESVQLWEFSEETREFIAAENINSWMYSTVIGIINKIIQLYFSWKTQKKGASEEDQQKAVSERKNLIYEITKSFADLGMIIFYKQYSFAFKPTLSYLFGVTSSWMDLFMILKFIG